MSDFDSAAILAKLAAFRAADAPTHGGRVLSYVYDPGLDELDELVADAVRLFQPVNGLDPTTFTSVAALESEVLGFARDLLHGSGDVVGNVTSGGTESCLLAVKTARDLWRSAGGMGRPRLLAPATVHAAFHKAARYFDLDLDLIPVSTETGAVDAADMIAALGDDVALVVVSAPSYPYGALDPVADVAAACADAGIPLHVDACIGGLILPFWGGDDVWDFRIPGVTSISADLHKFGYAPKGASVLVHRGRDRHRSQYFVTMGWAGYPVINPTMLGSKSATALAASWSIIQALGTAGFTELAQSCRRATAALAAAIQGIEGLRVFGDPTGPLLAIAVDDAAEPERRVDPHLLADQARLRGWGLQLQPGLTQRDGSRLPHTTHLTITPVTEARVTELVADLVACADAVRGVPRPDVTALLGALGGLAGDGPIDSETAAAILGHIGITPDSPSLPGDQATLLALIESLPRPLTERLLVELLARVIEPR
ncbi:MULTISPECIES: pyridoxal phosphate-dependent decarboxylase family protein [unclassified Microbacterium]|uniref:pyridoxal phosphate-dependent decarboxylase family protein n=1 Tax=unclassified Microbacterium TaxID=2609290 RepID=UPI0030196785